MILKRLFCNHDLAVIENTQIDVYAHADDKMPVRRKRVIIQRCKKCGKLLKNIITY